MIKAVGGREWGGTWRGVGVAGWVGHVWAHVKGGGGAFGWGMWVERLGGHVGGALTLVCSAVGVVMFVFSVGLWW